MFARWKMRKIFRMGGSTHASATKIMDSKSVWMVNYLRARQELSEPSRSIYRRGKALEHKRWARRIHLGLEDAPGSR